MKKVPDSKELSDFDLTDFKVPALEKYTDKRGYMYIVFNSKFPEYIKVGRTSDAYKRLQQYNADTPYPTSKMLYVSELFENVNIAERKILRYMYECTEPTTLSKEWFEYEHIEKIINIILKAEELEHINNKKLHLEEHW